MFPTHQTEAATAIAVARGRNIDIGLLLWNDIEDTLGRALMPSLPLLLLQIAFILGACRLLTPVFARLGQPAVMAEMTAGLLLGPSCFGWLAPDLSAFVFPDGSLPTLALISQVGLVLFMFLVGWRLDVGHLRSIGRVALVTSLVSIIVPFSLGSSVAAVAWYRYAPPGVDAVPFALFMGTAMSITAFPVLVRILMDRQLLTTTIGTLAVACAAFDDAVGWLILAAITAIVRAGSLADAGLPLLGLGLRPGHGRNRAADPHEVRSSQGRDVRKDALRSGGDARDGTRIGLRH